MFKKVLYIIIVLVIIVILAIMWKDSNKTESPAPVDQTTEQIGQKSPSITEEIDSINVDSGIDADLEQIDNEINTL